MSNGMNTAPTRTLCALFQLSNGRPWPARPPRAAVRAQSFPAVAIAGTSLPARGVWVLSPTPGGEAGAPPTGITDGW
jgi:hypothetical protein